VVLSFFASDPAISIILLAADLTTEAGCSLEATSLGMVFSAWVVNFSSFVLYFRELYTLFSCTVAEKGNSPKKQQDQINCY
jgi:hypothetical protein